MYAPDTTARLARCLLALVFVGLLLAANSASAHRMRPAVVTITLNQNQSYDLTIVANAEALLAGIGPKHQDTDDAPNAAFYNELRELPPTALNERITAFEAEFRNGISLTFDGRASVPQLIAADVPPVGDVSIQRLTTMRFRGDVPPDARDLVWTYSTNYGSSAVRVGRAGEPVEQSAFLAPGQASAPFAIGAPLQQQSVLEISANYLTIGFTHIVPKGLDHILFVLGIFLLSVAWRPLLYQVTAFTIAHTITLGMSLYGLISLPASIVEPLIAASIIYVGVENILTPQLKPWRVIVVFAFGLLHGMGFAGVLTEIGLPEGQFVNALISFNIGVELGQLAVIAAAYFAVGIWFKGRDWYRRVVVIPGSAAIALVGAYWAAERALG